jgi:hypothetical protein
MNGKKKEPILNKVKKSMQSPRDYRRQLPKRVKNRVCADQ